MALGSGQQLKTVAKKVPMKKSRFYLFLKVSAIFCTSSKILFWRLSLPRQYFLASLECKLSEGFSLNPTFRCSMNLEGVSCARQLKKSKAFVMPWSKYYVAMSMTPLLMTLSRNLSSPFSHCICLAMMSASSRNSNFF